MNDDERTLADRCWRGRTPVEDELFLQLKITNEMSIDQTLWLVHAPGREVKLTVANTSIKPDMDKYYESMGDEVFI